MPELVHQLREAAQKHGTNLAKASDETAAIRNASTQQGAAGDAAREALGHSVTTFDGAKMKGHELALDTWMVENHAAKVKQDIDELVRFAESGRYPCKIDEISNTVTPPDMAFLKGQEKKDAEAKHVQVQNRVLQVAAELETVCEEFAAVITEATSGEIPPGIKEGAADAQAVKAALADGKLPPPEVLHRLGQITNLSEADKKAWEAGRLTIPQSSMDYLNSFSRSLDGQSIQDLKTMMNKLPEPDAKNLMNGLQMISDPKVQAPGKGDKVMAGSFERLPDGIKNVAGNTPKLEGNVTVGQFQDLLGDRKDLATIMSKGGADFMHGSDLDRAVLKQSEQLLDKIPEKSWTSGDGALNGPIKDSREAIQSMLSAVGRDNMAVHDLVAGVDGNKPNDRFIGELMKQDWNDDGRGAGTLAHGIPDVANDASQAGAAQRAGETVHAFDQYIGNHGKELSEITLSSGEKMTFADLNPEFDKELGRANSNFTDDMVGKNLDNTRGFEPLDEIRGKDANMPHTRDLFGILDGNSDAAKALHGSVDQNVLAYQDQYAKSLLEGHTPDSSALAAGGQLQGLDDVGSSMAHSQDGKLDYKNAMQIYQDKADALDAFKKAGGELPQVKQVLDNIGRMPGGDNMLKDMLLGKPPEQFIDSHIPVKDIASTQYHIAQQLFAHGYGDKSMFSNGFPSYEEAIDPKGIGGGDAMNDIRKYLGTSVHNGIDIRSDIGEWTKGYDGTMPRTPPPFGS
ncbi:TPR repeat region-containing protein [Mycobacteroides abscessus]|uniref:TPR repeat region-containing protein n=1 Tax=Mycobacteroides abscessus TaxID=36809 RepID=UPI00130005A2|nr:hypothetical protein [Mycobacteroides abscessus]